MIITIDSVLSLEELQLVVDCLAQADFVDGSTTAGWHAKLVKKNTQLDSQGAQGQKLEKLVKAALKDNSIFKIAVRPKIIHSLLFSRYEPGMCYGRHTDNALMGKDQSWRADISFTLFLNSPSTYAGGELVLEGPDEEHSYKLEAGSMLIYPSSTLHRVETVTEGVRLAAIGWVQSWIRDAQEREILFDLDTARRSLFTRVGKTIEFDLISKTHANLLRKWAD